VLFYVQIWVSLFVYLFRFTIYVFYESSDQFIPMLLAFVVLGLVVSVPSRNIGWEERLRNDLFCVKWDVIP